MLRFIYLFLFSTVVYAASCNPCTLEFTPPRHLIYKGEFWLFETLKSNPLPLHVFCHIDVDNSGYGSMGIQYYKDTNIDPYKIDIWESLYKCESCPTGTEYVEVTYSCKPLCDTNQTRDPNTGLCVDPVPKCNPPYVWNVSLAQCVPECDENQTLDTNATPPICIDTPPKCDTNQTLDTSFNPPICVPKCAPDEYLDKMPYRLYANL